MPTAEFFARLGLFVARDFLDTALRERLRDEAGSFPWQPAEVFDAGVTVNEALRRTLSAGLPEALGRAVDARLEAVRPALERHFCLALTAFEPPKLLRYREGGFFVPHRDIPPEPGLHAAERRQLSLVIFVNSQREQPEEDAYCGGSLTFYGLLDDPRAASFGFPLTGEAGLLVAFPSRLFHEVKPVTHGERYTVVSWYC